MALSRREAPITAMERSATTALSDAVLTALLLNGDSLCVFIYAPMARAEIVPNPTLTTDSRSKAHYLLPEMTFVASSKVMIGMRSV